jgi:hypothetical protein
MMSACGVMCSECPAFNARKKGTAFQQRVVEAWSRIFGLNEIPGHISCSGCHGPDEEIFYSSRKCKARICCRSKGLGSCAECSDESCTDLKKAQSVWDEVPYLVDKLTPADFNTYARPYCGHRERLTDARIEFQNRK